MSPTKTVEVPLGGAEDCEPCADRLRVVLRDHRGIEAVEPVRSGHALRVSYDPDRCSPDCLEQASERAQVELSSRYEHWVVGVEGMDCYDCAQKIERAVGRMPGVTAAEVNLPAAQMRVEYQVGLLEQASVADQVRKLGYRTVAEDGSPEVAERTLGGLRAVDALTAISGALLLVGLLVDLLAGSGLAAVVYAASIAVGAGPIARAGIAGLRATHRPDIKLLMTIAVIGAAAIGAWMEGALVVVLFSIGEMLEGRAVARARRELAGLVSLAPERARRRLPGSSGEEDVAASELTAGDVVVVRPGERMPADGSVLEGSSAVNQAPITGESTPVDKQPGDPIFAGTLNEQGMLAVTVEREPGDTTLARIGKLVAEAQARKSPSERWVDAFARIYTPIVIAIAVGVAALPPLLLDVAFSDSLYSALALLILACPCALVLSTPVSIVSSLGRASAAGVLVKGGGVLESAATIRTVAFDKTGTLTSGSPEVVEVRALSGSEDELLALAASLEQASQHPLGKAIVAAAVGRSLPLRPVEDFEALTGLGARGRVDGMTLEIGRPALFEAADLGAAASTALEQIERGGRTAVAVVRDGVPIGALGLADPPRPEAAQAVAALGRLGIERTVLLTGDNEATARAIAAQVGLSDVRAGLMPEDKSTAIEALGEGVAMVGDGVNDAPALAASGLGVAMGSAGSDTAIEVADVALMGDDPRKVAELIGLSRWTRAVVRQNVAFSLGTKLVAAGFLAAGALPLWAAVASDVGASLIVVANGLRLVVGSPRGRLGGVPLLPAGQQQAADVDAAPAAAAGPDGAAGGESCCTDGACVGEPVRERERVA